MFKSVFLEVSRKCNLRCLFCSNSSDIAVDNELDTLELLELVENLHQIGIKSLRFYGGEPFLKEDVFEIIQRARHFGMDVSIYTNGTIFNASIRQNIIKYGIEKICLSIDGASALIHDKIRGVEGSFDKTIYCMDDLLKNGIRIDIFFTVCRFNKDDITAIYQMLHSAGVHAIKANFVSNAGRARQNWNELFLTSQEIRDCISEIKKNHFNFYGQLLARKFCEAGVEKAFIASNGDVFPCALFLDERYKAGNIRDRSINNILDKPTGLFKEVGDVVRSKSFCFACAKKSECGGGCRARAAAGYNGDFFERDIISCMFHKEVI